MPAPRSNLDDVLSRPGQLEQLRLTGTDCQVCSKIRLAAVKLCRLFQ